MERSLHRELKERYGSSLGGQLEVVVDRFRIDAITAEGRLIEVQSGPLSLLRSKLEWLLPTRKVDVIKPVVVGKRVIRRDRPGGGEGKARRSPKRGQLLDIFDDLVGLAKVFPHANLGIDVLAVDVDEVRVTRARWPGYEVIDRRLTRVVETVSLRTASDLWSLLPDDPPDRFTTADLALWLGRSMAFAQRVAYCLQHAGAVRVIDKVGRNRLFESTRISCDLIEGNRNCRGR